MVRYTDDFVILCKIYSSAQDALRHTEEFLSQRGLKIKQTKEPLIVHITQGFDLRGGTYRRITNDGFHKKLTLRPPIFDDHNLEVLPWYDPSITNGKKYRIVLVTVSKSKLKFVCAGYKEVFRFYRGFKVSVLIKALNPKIKLRVFQRKTRRSRFSFVCTYDGWLKGLPLSR